LFGIIHQFDQSNESHQRARRAPVGRRRALARALLDEEHVHHGRILGWLAREENLPHGFATCAMMTAGNPSAGATLLATAVENGCRLVTFDSGIPVQSVTGAKREHLVVLGN